MLVIVLVSILAILAFYLVVSALIANGMAMSARVPIDKTPASLGLTYQDVSFRSRPDSVLLKGWYIPGQGNGTIIVMHGGKQNRADTTMKLLELCGELARKGFNVLTFDRRGCGLSQTSWHRVKGRFERDFAGAFDYIRSRNGFQEKVFIMGFSVGAVAAFVFARQEGSISGIISDSCFARTPEMVKRVLNQTCTIFQFFTPASLWMGEVLFGLERGSAVDRVGDVKCPIFFINGAEDEVVPPEDAYQLLQVSNNSLDEIWIVLGAR
jgi:pimeloyl-ACP methyl ester carboxylesterase